MESTEYDAAVEKLEELVSELEGWFESSYQDNGNSYNNYRSANYTIRVPAKNFSGFCDNVGALCKIRNISRSAQDVSESYYDLESRLTTQKIKLERLQALLEEAKKMEDIITLESAISDTEYTIENLTGSLRHYDSLVGYSTITVRLTEVYQIVETEEPAIGFDAKLTAAFRAGTAGFINGLQEFVLDFARSWASWVIFLLIVLILVLLIRRAVRRRAERRGEVVRKPRRHGRKGGELPAESLPAETPSSDQADNHS